MWIGLGLGLVAKMSTAGTCGKLGEYYPDCYDWTEYVEQMEHFFSANDTEEESKKKAIFVASLRLKNEIGERQYALRRLGQEACAGMPIADTQTRRTHLAFSDTV